MATARATPSATPLSLGVGELNAARAVGLTTAPDLDRALAPFVVPDPGRKPDPCLRQGGLDDRGTLERGVGRGELVGCELVRRELVRRELVGCELVGCEPGHGELVGRPHVGRLVGRQRGERVPDRRRLLDHGRRARAAEAEYGASDVGDRCSRSPRSASPSRPSAARAAVPLARARRRGRHRPGVVADDAAGAAVAALRGARRRRVGSAAVRRAERPQPVVPHGDHVHVRRRSDAAAGTARSAGGRRARARVVEAPPRGTSSRSTSRTTSWTCSRRGRPSRSSAAG